MKVLDLFAGIGGFSFGLECAGFETVAFCEIDEHAQAVLHKHWPGVPIFPDVNLLSCRDLPGIDVITAGFPCQDLSKAGGQAGIHGERSGLWSEVIRLTDELRPSYVILENVPTLRSKGLIYILQALEQIGYDAEWHVVPASAVGAFHCRERLWVIAYPSDEHRKEPIIDSIPHVFTVGEERPGFDNEGLRSWIEEWRGSCLLRGVDEVPTRLARHALRQYGNAVVPVIPQLIGWSILDYERQSSSTN